MNESTVLTFMQPVMRGLSCLQSGPSQDFPMLFVFSTQQDAGGK